MSFVCINRGKDIEITNGPLQFFYSNKTHNLMSASVPEAGIRIQRKSDEKYEIYFAPLADFIDISGSVIASNFSDLSDFLNELEEDITTGEGLSINSGNITLNIASTEHLGGVKVGPTLKIDNEGLINTVVSYTSTKVINSQVEMLTLPTINVVYQAIRTDINKIMYLPANLNPMILTNWIEGATIEGVEGFQGPLDNEPRIGIITPQAGDYSSDQVYIQEKDENGDLTGKQYTFGIQNGVSGLYEI